MSQPKLIASDVYPSLAPPRLVLACEWHFDGRVVYSSALCTHENLADLKFWNDQETAMVKWFAAHKRKHGEIACIRT